MSIGSLVSRVNSPTDRTSGSRPAPGRTSTMFFASVVTRTSSPNELATSGMAKPTQGLRSSSRLSLKNQAKDSSTNAGTHGQRSSLRSSLGLSNVIFEPGGIVIDEVSTG